MKHWKERIIRAYFHIVRMVLGINKKKVVFISFGGKSYSDNPRAISEALATEKTEAEIVWLFINPTDKKCIVSDGIRCVDVSRPWRVRKEIATASVYVNNFALSNLPKSNKQLFIQTWHGDKAFKKVLHDEQGWPPDKVLGEQIPGMCDYAIAGSDYGERQYRSAFLYKGNVLKCGMPRNDRLILQDEQEKERIRKKLNCSQETQLLLYAPTLRREEAQKKVALEIKQLDITKTLTMLEERDHCKWICLMRAHPKMVGLSYQGEDERIVDVSEYEDMGDLLLISDMLITDYSSCAGDFALTGRPVVLFHADRQEYLKDRSFYFDMDESPYYIAESQEELEAILSGLTQEKAKQNCKEILKFYGDCETGHASETVAKIIKDWIER
ncbi:MAG: CDP-glycerol glycerophosphotransferase family protein [Oscillospiraceae bacterium]|nr:CDP-glycerol glycerophosphotransferase family protein [Oscillospiraceae bacterium]